MLLLPYPLSLEPADRLCAAQEHHLRWLKSKPLFPKQSSCSQRSSNRKPFCNSVLASPGRALFSLWGFGVLLQGGNHSCTENAGFLGTHGKAPLRPLPGPWDYLGYLLRQKYLWREFTVDTKDFTFQAARSENWVHCTMPSALHLCSDEAYLL